MTSQKATPLIVFAWQHNTPAFVIDTQGDPWMGVSFNNLIISFSVVMPKHLHVEIHILLWIIFPYNLFLQYNYIILTKISVWEVYIIYEFYVI